MAQAETQVENADAQPGQPPALESGAYEIIRGRLSTQAAELRKRLEVLNNARKEVFGSIETTLVTTERITTENNCVPRDMVAVGGHFIFGYNVHFGLKTERNLSDVFAVYRFEDRQFHQEGLDLLSDATFQRDFQELFKYYRNTVFARFAVIGPHLFMVFRVGESPTDVKTFKWAITEGGLKYLDNRSDHQYKFPAQHEFEWIRTTRDMHHHGMHPHVSIEDRVFVETVGGDLTIKVENNTESGEGIYAEPVDNADQVLDDADIYYAIVGNIILLKIRPYQEKEYRYFVYNEKIVTAIRLDSLKDACVLLPSDHGLIFSNGYYLQTGEYKTFSGNLENMLFERRVQAPNGEDYLYAFYNRRLGEYVLLPYNLIAQHVEQPILCNGFTFFENGELILFKAQADPQKHHAIQIWQTPYVGPNYVPETQSDSYLFKIGNRDIVRCMAECHEVLTLIGKQDTYAALYLDLVKKCTDITDTYFWLERDEAANLKETVNRIREAATAAIDEFEKVTRLRQNTKAEVDRVSKKTAEIFRTIKNARFDTIDQFVHSLASLREVRGEIISLRDLRYVDGEQVDALEADVAKSSETLSQKCVEFLLGETALAPYDAKVDEQQAQIAELTKVTNARELEAAIDGTADELQLLIDIVSNLKIDDATQRTRIIDGISAIFSRLNQSRAALKTKTRELLSTEGVAEFNSQLKLLNQGVVNYLDICDTPDKCDEYLTKVMVQIEELEGRFAEFDEFVVQLSEKRDEVYNAFEARKLSLVEARNKRASALASAADRILKGIKTRVDNFKTINEINGYFASDLMIEKVRDIVRQLEDLEDTVKVSDIQSRLKTIREDAVRQLKDRQELFVDGENVIKFGKHRFSVNTQPLDLTTVLKDGQMEFHLTGTNFFERIKDEDFLATRDVWDQEVLSENRDVYRGEYLAYQLLRQSLGDHETSVNDLTAMSHEERLAFVQQFMGPRYHEGYTKGVHDLDGTAILESLLDLHRTVGLLRYRPPARALAHFYWRRFDSDREMALLEGRVQGFGVLRQLFPESRTQEQYVSELQSLLAEFVKSTGLFPTGIVDEAGEYLFAEISTDDRFVASKVAVDLFYRFHDHLKQHGFAEQFENSVKKVVRDAVSTFRLHRDWVRAFVAEHHPDLHDYVDEVAVQLFDKAVDEICIVDAPLTREVTGLLGNHPRFEQGKYQLHYTEFRTRLSGFQREVVPRFTHYVERKRQLVDVFREDLRLEEFRPRVLTSFVRNKLIDQVYLPLVGDNLAKQMGVVGEGKRTDLMGLLLLISPPGYGKTTLMEYIANRLGIIFMKINGPAIGHQVTSLDPDEAPNASAREEIEKLNLSLEMGDNVMIYLDDIQHCNPEFLQKFISLCDAQRKIEGVYKGRTRTYDLRGRKVAVVMAGNPYTESGSRFRIPDMLANRADTYNLGDIIGNTADVFELSYLENCLTSNPVLNKLASRSQKDVYAVIKIAETGSQDGVELEANYGAEELSEMVAVTKKLLRVRDVILKVNQQYIASAAQNDDYRTEPPFQLQGSYRDMNKIAEKVVTIMNDEELESLIHSHYINESQTLTTGAEANLLKFKELIGAQTDVDRARWEDIKKTFNRNKLIRGAGGDDRFGQVVAQLATFSEGLSDIRDALTRNGQDTPTRKLDELTERLDAIREVLSTGIAALGNGASGGKLEATFNQEAFDTLKALIAEISGPNQHRHKIRVVNEVPDTIVDVLQHQFVLMQKWLDPLLATSLRSSVEINDLRGQLKEALDRYDTLLGKVSKAKKSEK